MKNKNEIRKKTDMNVKKMYKTSAWKRMFNLIFNVHFLRCNANNNWFNQRFIFIWCDLKNVSFLCSRYKSCQSVIHTFSTLRFFPLFFFLFHSFFFLLRLVLFLSAISYVFRSAHAIIFACCLIFLCCVFSSSIGSNEFFMKIRCVQ